MRCKEKRIKLSRIDSDDDTFRITTDANTDDLMVSIHHVGLLNLPLLVENNSDYTIVSGFRRIEACQRLGWSHINARILDSDTHRFECVRYAISDNAFQRPLNLIEQSRSIHMLSGFFKDQSRLAQEMSVFGLPANQSVITKIIRVCHLSSPIQSGILSNTISLSTALELDKLKQDAGDGLAILFNCLKLGLNRQREIITLVKEIALRDGMSIQDVLEAKGVQDILGNEDLNGNQKARKLRIYLRQRRFPSIAVAEKEFEKHVKKLKLGSGTKLIPPDNFEGADYTLKISFKNLAELKNRKTTFDTVIRHPSLEKILE